MENVTSLNEHNAASPAATLQLTCMFKFVVLQTGSSFLDLPTSIVSIVSAILAIMGNTLILISLFRTASIAPPSKVLLGSLALTDLGVGLLAQPLYIVKSLSSDKDTKCFLGLLFDLLSGHLSITSFFTMMFISVDKFLALHLKLRYRIVVTLKRSILVVVLARLVALPWSLSYIWFSEVYFMLILSIMPWCLLISSLAFIKIHRILRRQKRTYQDETQLESVRRANILKISRYKKSVNSMLFVFCALLIAYVPAWMVILLRTIYGNTEILKMATKLTMTLILMNSACNPILYLWRMEDLRVAALQALEGLIPKSQFRSTSTNAIESFELQVDWLLEKWLTTSKLLTTNYSSFIITNKIQLNYQFEQSS